MSSPIDVYTGFYSKIEKAVEPFQDLVSVFLVIVIVGSVWALFTKDPVKRTFWALYVWLP